MTISLYDAYVPSTQQILAAMKPIIDKAETHVNENGLSDSDLIDAKLADDMWTLPWHVRSCWLHGANTFDQIQNGEFTPDFTDIPSSWDAMRAMIDDALARLEALAEDDVAAIADKTVGFVMGGQRMMEFTGANFLLSFNQPNIYFHATTFYDILRMKGVALGKRDFMGVPRLKV